MTLLGASWCIVANAHCTDFAPEAQPVFMAPTTARWTLSDLDGLPDDGNRYELVDGELFVTPPPSHDHEDVLAVLSALLIPYVARHALGRVYHPRAVVQAAGSQAEPDLMVRPVPTERPVSWAGAPLPILVVEGLSGSTWRRDHVEKRSYYVRIGVPCYWMLDRRLRAIRVVRPGHDDIVSDSVVSWHPDGASVPLVIDVRALFGEALGPARSR